jgi:Predicted membrane protein (DUF2142)
MLRTRATPLALALSVVLLTVAWLIANPPGAAPDEPAQYIKALGAAGGQLAGEQAPSAEKAEFIRSQAAFLMQAGESRQLADKGAEWFWLTSRLFRVPAGALSSAFGCNRQQEQTSWACLNSGHPVPRSVSQESTYIGTYPPFVYLPAGALARLGGNPETRLWLGRAGMAALAVALLMTAAFVLFDRRTGGLSLLGLIATVTPMVVFVSSILSDSGPEVSAAICFAASLFRLAREQPSPRWVWVALAASGIVLAISRQLGPEFICLTLVCTVILYGRGRMRRAFVGRAALFAWIAVALACICALVWDFLYGAHPTTTLGGVVAAIPASIKSLATIARQEIGDFGQLDSPLPVPASIAWFGMLGALLWIAFRVGDSSLRKRLGWVTLCVVGSTVLVSALQRQTGWYLQGRHALAMFVLLPLSAGEVVHLEASRLTRTAARLLVIGMTATAGLVQAVAWFANGRRVAVGIDGSWFYAFSAKWQPPLGWLPWTAMVLAAFLLYLVAGRLGTAQLQPVDADARWMGARAGLSLGLRRSAGAWLRSMRAMPKLTSEPRD